MWLIDTYLCNRKKPKFARKGISNIFKAFPNNPWFSHPYKKPLKTLWEKEKMLVTSIFSFFPTMLSSLSETEIIIQASVNLSSANAFSLVQMLPVWCPCSWGKASALQSWGPEFESRERVSTLGFFIGPHIRREYWCSSQEAGSREISISCKNFFLNRCKINMFKLNAFSLVKAKIL